MTGQDRSSSRGASGSRPAPQWHEPVSPRLWLDIMRQSVVGWIDDDCASRGAALAYYTLFSLAPLLLIVVSMAGLVFGAEAARGEVFRTLEGLMGARGAAAVQDLLVSVDWPNGGALASSVGAVLMVVGATTVFAELQSTLDHIWDVPATRAAGWWRVLRARLLSFGLILGVGFLLIVSLLFDVAVSALQKWSLIVVPHWSGMLDTLGTLAVFGTMTLTFAVIYKRMPRARIAWSDVWVGALVTTVLFSIGRQLIGLYIGRGALSSGFGAAGSMVALLAWVYYSAQIFLLGAEFTWTFAHRLGSRRGTGGPV